MSNMVVNTNVLALNSHRNLKTTGVKQAQASSRLSSGLRVNSAADDAAGLAISEKMRAQIRGLDQASKNAQDGSSLVQTAEGGMQEIDNMIQRIRELVVQASNDTNDQSTGAELSQGDRRKIQDEIDQLSSEIDSMAKRVEFNKKKVIDGTYSDAAQALADATKLYNEASLDSVGLTAKNTDAQAAYNNTKADVAAIKAYLDGYDNVDISAAVTTAENTLKAALGAIASFTSPGNDGDWGAGGLGDATAAQTAVNGLMSTAATNAVTALQGGASINDVLKTLTTAFVGAINGALNGGKTIGANADGISINNVDVNAASYTEIQAAFAKISTALTQYSTDVKNALDTAQTTYLATSFNVTSKSNGATTEGTAEAITPTAGADNASTIAGVRELYAKALNNNVTALKAANEAQIAYDMNAYDVKRYSDKLDAAALNSTAKALYFQIGANATQGIEVSINSVKTDALGIGDGNGTTHIDIMKASGKEITNILDSLDEALTIVTTERSKLGAIQNRLEYSQRSLDISSENLSASESRIRDTDMAKEMMKLTQANVLQQAATSMLAQANQAPQSVLQLLQ